MQNLKREKDRISIENDSLREVNRILSNKMAETSKKIKANCEQIQKNKKEIERIEKKMKVKMRENKQNI